jgi:hypothetical protein
MSRVPAITDLVPRRGSFYAFVLLGGLGIVLTLGGLYRIGIALGSRTTDGMVAALDLDSEGSIACWFSIILYFVAGTVTLLIRRLKMVLGVAPRERRCWLALAMLWFVMSLDEGASLHEGFKSLMTMATGTPLMGDGSVYWAVPYFVLLSMGGMFLLVQIRRIPAAVFCLFSAGVCFAIAIAGQLDFILAGRPLLETWVEESGEMMGQLFIMVSVGLYCREVADRVSGEFTAHVAPIVEPHARPGIRRAG